VAESHDPQSFGPDFSEKSAGKMPAVHGRVRLFVVAEATTHKAFSSFTLKPRPTKRVPGFTEKSAGKMPAAHSGRREAYDA
jgi:hypothetical protein